MTKRIQFSQYGDPSVLTYVDIELNDLCDNEVLITHKAIGVNFIDTYVRSGLYPVTALPSGLGTEAAGIVEKVGRNVTHIKQGDRVAYCQSSLGAYSQQHIVNANNVVVLPDFISFEVAAASLLKGLTVHYLLTQTYQIKKDEKFLFHAAAGGVGSIACQWAKHIGAKLIGTVGSTEKAVVAKQNGAWETINYHSEDVVKRVMALTDNQKLNVVYDSVGKDMWQTSLDCLKKRGLMVSFGNSSGAVTGVNLGILNQKGSLFVTRPSLSGYITNSQELKLAANDFFALLQVGAIKVDINPEQVFALKDAALAHQKLANRQTTGSCLLIP